MQVVVSKHLIILLRGMKVSALAKTTACVSHSVRLKNSRLVLNPHLSAGDAQLIHQLEVSPQLLATDLAGEQPAIMAYGLRHLLRGLVDKFEAEMPDTQRQKS